jgi:hypothetical protein
METEMTRYLVDATVLKYKDSDEEGFDENYDAQLGVDLCLPNDASPIRILREILERGVKSLVRAQPTLKDKVKLQDWVLTLPSTCRPSTESAPRQD